MSKNTGILSIIAAKRGRNQDLSDVERALIVQKMDTGGTLRTVVAEAKCSPATVFNIFQRWKTDQTLDKKKPNPGVLGNSQFKRFGANIARTTIRRVIRFHYDRKWRAMQRIPLSQETARQRSSWCQAWREDIEELLLTIFSDESSVQSQPNYKRGWIFRKPHEKFMKELNNITAHGKSKLSIMVWGAIWKGGKSDIVIMIKNQTTKRKGYTSRSYQEALSEGLLHIHDGTRQFQQDNARIHTSEATVDWMLQHGIQWIDWPAHGPDLNPIEHIWKQLKLNIRKMCPQLDLLENNEVDRAKLVECIKLAWAAIFNLGQTADTNPQTSTRKTPPDGLIWPIESCYLMT